MNHDDTMRDEYSADLIRSGERGKYARRYAEGTNLVLLDPELQRLFPDSDAVNNALRQYAREHHLGSS